MNEHNPFQNALSQLTQAKKHLNFSSAVWDTLENPQREITVHFPVVMDDGHRQIFHGFRVQYNNFFGPYKGGMRFHPGVNLDEVRALAFWMMLKNAIVDIPVGGGKGGVIVDPKVLSSSELQRVTRGFIKAIHSSIGPYIDVPGPDMGTPPNVMGWMAEEYKNQILKSKTQKLSENEVLATFTGKPVDKGGIEGRDEATGRGGIFVLQSLLEKLRTKNLEKSQPTIAVQGFGNLGFHFAKIAKVQGFNVVAVSDSKNAIYVPQGLNPEHTLECKQKTGSLAKCMCTDSSCDIRNGKLISNEELLELPVDILVPAAIENVITGENAHRIKALIVFEMANGPTTTEADEVLAQKGVLVIPDILANSGGVTVSAFEWQQNLKNEHWTLPEVRSKLKKKMETAFETVWEQAQKNKMSLRTAAFVVAIKRLVKKIHQV